MGAASTVGEPPLRVALLTTSYPRHPGDTAGTFVAAAVENLRKAGVDVTVVSPQHFRHFGIAYGHGVVGNLRRRPWLLLLLPLMLANFRRAARRAARDADLVHAHWLPSGMVALGCGRPLVVQLWGTDVVLARRMPRLARRTLRHAQVVICPSRALADEARRLGAREPVVIPSAVELPPEPGREAEPAELLYVGRLSAEKGVLELIEATRDMRLVVAGNGPLRQRVPDALGFVPHDRVGELYERAAVVCCPSHREGFGMTCAEAMAHARPVVASAVGGLLDLVVDGETGLLVAPRDVPALRAACERLLGDPDLRRRMGEAGRRRIAERFSWPGVVAQLLEAYDRALAGTAQATGR
ncbi:MAG: glycosyltransferase family 4 protein [Gaiellaceae bacterium]